MLGDNLLGLDHGEVVREEKEKVGIQGFKPLMGMTSSVRRPFTWTRSWDVVARRKGRKKNESRHGGTDERRGQTRGHK
jgi:hypothetical protein